MFFCWGTKSDKDELPYAWYYQGQPLRRGQKHDDKIRPVVVGAQGPVPGEDLEHHHVVCEPRDGRRSDRRRRDRATEQNHVSRARTTRTSSGSGSSSGPDSPARDTDRDRDRHRHNKYYFQFQHTNTYFSRSESNSWTCRASPESCDETSSDSSSGASSLDDPFVTTHRVYSRQEQHATIWRPHEDHDVGRRPSPTAGYRPPTNHSPQGQGQGQVQVQVHYPVVRPLSAQYQAAAPRPSRAEEYISLPIRSRRARHSTPSASASGRGRRDSRALRHEGISQPRQRESGPGEGENARPAWTQQERAESRFPLPRPRPLEGSRGESISRSGRQQVVWDQAPVVGLCECEVCRADAYS